MSIGRLLDISVRSLSAYQQAIEVSSLNISNAGNANYARQRVVFGTESTEKGIGTGVKIEDITRVKNQLLESQILKYNSQLADANKRSELLSQVEAVIGEPSDVGLSQYFNEFFNSWHELTNSPNSIQARNKIIQSAQRLSERVQEVFDGFSSVNSILQSEANVKVDELNAYLKEINELNQKIYSAEVGGLNSGEMKDRRDLLIQKISEITNVTVQMNQYGTATVSVGGILAADQNYYSEFEMKLEGGKLRLVSKNDPTAVAVINGGELYAITDLYSSKMPAYKTDLENLINNFISQVNDLHMQGYPLQIAGSTNGIPFFGQADGFGNVENYFKDGRIIINQDILNDPKKIAASSAANNDGNGTIANEIASLADRKIPLLNNQTILESYANILNNFGMEKVISDNKIESSQLVVQQLNNQKASYSGVSIDEEMANVLRFQKSYEAAAKLVKIAEEMLQTIIALV